MREASLIKIVLEAQRLNFMYLDGDALHTRALRVPNVLEERMAQLVASIDKGISLLATGVKRTRVGRLVRALVQCVVPAP
jgi:hypothetical protein